MVKEGIKEALRRWEKKQTWDKKCYELECQEIKKQNRTETKQHKKGAFL